MLYSCPFDYLSNCHLQRVTLENIFIVNYKTFILSMGCALFMIAFSKITIWKLFYLLTIRIFKWPNEIKYSVNRFSHKTSFT